MIKTISVGDEPINIVYNPTVKDIYVTNSGSDTVSVIDGATDTVIKTIDVGDEPRHLVYNPSNKAMYVGNHFGHDVSVINSFRIK